MESRKSGGDVQSPGLSAAIERAKRDSMPKENIERAVARGAGSDGTELEEVLFEGYGPGGVALLVYAVTDNKNRTAPEIRSIFSKAGYQLGTPGSALWAFKKSSSGYEPTAPINLSDEDGEKLANLIERIEEQEDVQDVYTTADTLENL